MAEVCHICASWNWEDVVTNQTRCSGSSHSCQSLSWLGLRDQESWLYSRHFDFFLKVHNEKKKCPPLMLFFQPWPWFCSAAERCTESRHSKTCRVTSFLGGRMKIWVTPKVVAQTSFKLKRVLPSARPPLLPLQLLLVFITHHSCFCIQTIFTVSAASFQLQAHMHIFKIWLFLVLIFKLSWNSPFHSHQMLLCMLVLLTVILG